MDSMPRIGFIGWNPFQFLHIRSIAAAFESACFVIEKRKEHISEFSDDILNDPNIPTLIWDRSKMALLDGVFDILICQTPFFRIEAFSKTKIVMVQYGYAKEPHNYGAWRAFADLCLTYGPYANRKIEPFCPAVPVGNPRFDVWHQDSFHQRAKASHSAHIDPSRKTVLYLPTWGELSSVDQYLETVYSLASKYNVLLKMHHNTQLLEPDRAAKVTAGAIRHYGANDDLLELLSVADIVISDYSGAIFDAIYCGKPVVLANTDISKQIGGKKIDNFSLEYSRRGELGIVANNPIELIQAVQSAAENPEQCTKSYKALHQELFTETSNATENAKKALIDLWNGHYNQNQAQMYVRTELKDLYNTKRQLAIASKKLKELSNGTH